MRRLENKVALVTGASQGVGRGISIAVGEEGAMVGVNYYRSEDKAKEVISEIEKRGGRAIALKADIRDENQVENMVKRLLDEFGNIHILINCAGMRRNHIALQDLSLKEWEDMLAVNLRGMFLCCRSVIPTMIKNREGKIINMSGTYGVRGMSGLVHLSTAKAGMIGFTRALAKEMAELNIQVNAVAPSLIKTDKFNEIPREKIEGYLKDIPMKRGGEMRELTETIIFLASDVSNYITGQTISPSGGEVMV